MLVADLENNKKISTIAIIRSSSIGDVVLASACLDYLQRIERPVSVFWIGRAPSLELIRESYSAATCLYIDEVNSVRSLDLLAKVDLIVDLQRNLRTRTLCFRLWRRFGIPQVKLKKRSLHRWAMVVMARLRGRRYKLPSKYQNCENLQYKRMLDSLDEGFRRLGWSGLEQGLALTSAHPRLPVLKDGQGLLRDDVSCDDWLAIGVGAAYETKQTPIEIMAGILKRCHAQCGGHRIGLFLLGSEKERDTANRLINQLSWPGPTKNFCGELSLPETMLVLKNSKVILANDSALAHLAEAVAVPCAALFGPTVEAFGFAPWHNKSKVFSTQLGCRPCSRHGKQICRYGDKKCFADLPLDEIALFLLNAVKA